jgi:hypothetical protein
VIRVGGSSVPRGPGLEVWGSEVDALPPVAGRMAPPPVVLSGVDVEFDHDVRAHPRVPQRRGVTEPRSQGRRPRVRGVGGLANLFPAGRSEAEQRSRRCVGQAEGLGGVREVAGDPLRVGVARGSPLPGCRRSCCGRESPAVMSVNNADTNRGSPG